MGMGIEARRGRARRYWEPHLRCCRDFQQCCLDNTAEHRSIAVLGAGRLYDLDVQSVLKHFSYVHLYDADPSCLPYWRRTFGAVVDNDRWRYQICDITGTLAQWSAQLQDFLRSHSATDGAALCRALRSLAALEPIALSDSADAQYSCVLSLNLLGQIPVYWLDRFTLLVRKFWNLRPDAGGCFECDLAEALESSMAKLELQHLKFLEQSCAAKIIIISDAALCYYRPDIAAWQAEPALASHDNPRESLTLSGYRRTRTESWLWHISPHGIEFKDHGEIHEVLALELTKS